MEIYSERGVRGWHDSTRRRGAPDMTRHPSPPLTLRPLPPPPREAQVIRGGCEGGGMADGSGAVGGFLPH